VGPKDGERLVVVADELHHIFCLPDELLSPAQLANVFKEQIQAVCGARCPGYVVVLLLNETSCQLAGSGAVGNDLNNIGRSNLQTKNSADQAIDSG
jgi:hypothetical protein